MKKKLTTNLGLKVLALLFSIAIWFIVININDPVDKTTFRNVQVEMLNESVISDANKTYNILDNSDVVDVTVWAKRSILDTLGKDNIVATADLEELNLADTMVRIKFSSNKYNDKIESIVGSSDSVDISIEDMKKSRLVISTTTVGDPADGFMLGGVTTDANLVEISGPESSISKVKNAQVAIDVTGLSQDVRTDASIRLYDEKDTLIDDKKIKKSIDQVKVWIEILATKRVPISYSVSGTPAEGYEVTGQIESSPSTILIAGRASVLNSISQITVPDTAINVSGKNGDMTTMINIRDYLPDGVSLADSNFSGKVSVTVGIDTQTTKQLTLSPDAVTIEGTPSDITATLQNADEDILVNVRGLEDAVTALSETDLKGTIDIATYLADHNITTLTSGIYSMPIIIQLPDNVSMVQQATTTVNIMQKTEEEKAEESAENKVEDEEKNTEKISE